VGKYKAQLVTRFDGSHLKCTPPNFYGLQEFAALPSARRVRMGFARINDIKVKDGSETL
jgi:hypothetical protein